MFMVLSSWQSHYESSPGLFDVERRQTAADLQTKPNDLGYESTDRLLESTPTITIYYHYSAQKLIFIVIEEIIGIESKHTFLKDVDLASIV